MAGRVFSIIHIAALLVTWGTGLTSAGFCGGGDRRRVEPFEALAFILICGLGGVAVAALLLADLGQFRLLWLDLAAVALGVWGWRKWRRNPPAWISTEGGRRTRFELGLLLLVAAVLFARPFEYMKGTWDPGVYTSLSAHIARTGSISARDSLLPDLPEADRELFCARRFEHFYQCFRIVDVQRGMLRPRFFHLYPAWAAVFGALFGWRGIFWANYLPSVGSVLLMYLLVRRAFSARAAPWATLFLMMSPAQIYFGRHQMSEPLGQFLLLGAFWALAWAEAQEADAMRRWGELASAGCWGAAFLTHSTHALPAAATIAGWLAWAPLFGRRPWRYASLMMLALGAAFLRNATQSSFTTFWLARVFLRREHAWATGAVLLAPVVLFAGIGRICARRPAARAPTALLRWALPIAVTGALLWGWFVRPLVSRDPDAINVMWLAKLVSPALLILAVAFFWIEPFKTWSLPQRIFILATGITAAVFLVEKMIAPIFLYAARRFVPAALPLCAATGAAGAVALFHRGFVGRAAAAALVGAALLGEGRFAWRVLGVREEKGLGAFYETLAAHVRGADLIFCDHPAHASPLRFIFGLPAYPWGGQDREDGVAYAQRRLRYLRQWAKGGKIVFYVAQGGLFFDPEIRLEEVARVRCEAPWLERERNRFPSRVRRSVHEAVVYLVRPRGEEREPMKEHAIEIGYHAFGLISGFHSAWRGREGWYRWTNGRAELYAPSFAPEADTELELTMAAKRPAGHAPVRAEIRIDGKPLTSVVVSQEWAEHRVVVPKSFLGESAPPVVKLGIACDPWDPAADGLRGYPTNLGVRVRRVRVRPAPGA